MKVEITNFRARISALFFGKDMLEYVARTTRNELHRWYGQLPEDWFDNPKPFPDGTPRHGGKRTFMPPLSEDWKYVLTENGFDLDFYFQKRNNQIGPWGLRLQHYGGEIRPVNKRALTIPVTAEAKGLSARNFQQKTGKKLFMIKKREAKDPNHIGSLVWEDPMGDLHAAYVLRSRTYVPPLRERRGHEAIPTDEQLQEWSARAYTNYLRFLSNYA